MLYVSGTLNFANNDIVNSIINGSCNTLSVNLNNTVGITSILNGGTGLSSIPDNSVFIGNGTNIPTIQTLSGVLVDTASTQTLSNKIITASTNSVKLTQLATVGADVDISAAAPPATGSVLTATSATTATWQIPSSVLAFSPTLYVFATKTTTSTGTVSGTIIYNSASVNLGGNYNTTTGNFTVPVTGYYYIHVTYALNYNNTNPANIILGIGNTTPGTNLNAYDAPTAYTSEITFIKNTFSIISLIVSGLPISVFVNNGSSGASILGNENFLQIFRINA